MYTRRKRTVAIVMIIIMAIMMACKWTWWQQNDPFGVTPTPVYVLTMAEFARTEYPSYNK